ncbi:hypothetical protein [Polyangium sp. 15x6]|uniref:hypothetical protein n=1 Tax=Polyangium sp. 15x6 TaxID=3042687 RepID=UPI002499E2CF|nr:hypothetical protein [Polyangium sp. 15x6]MDI3284944.1 hypothetical protein [Polyangium sp. 15x6]
MNAQHQPGQQPVQGQPSIVRVTAPEPKVPTWLAAAIVTSLVGVAVVVVVRLLREEKPKGPPTASAAMPTPGTSWYTEPRKLPDIDPVGDMMRALMGEPTFARAVQRTRPLMADRTNTPSEGATLLALWALAHPPTWADLAPSRDETSVGMVRKDSDGERGKRLCAPGQIIRIKVERLQDGSVASGSLLTDGETLIHFFALRDTGALVEDSRARFCGVVTGNFTFSNEHGTADGIQMVGMFDLPTNRAAPK